MKAELIQGKLLTVLAAVIAAISISTVSASGLAEPKSETSRSHYACRQAGQETVSEFFYSGERRIPITIRLDQIGVLAREGVTRQAMLPMERSLELSLEEEYPGGIFVFDLPQVRSEEDLSAFARGIRETRSDFVRQVGLVVWAEGAQAPMLMTDEFIVQFKEDVEDSRIEELLAAESLEILRRNPFTRNQFLLRHVGTFGFAALEASRAFAEDEQLVDFAHPNFIPVVILRETIPNDTLFADQWHHRNTGQGGGTVDADIDTTEAWDFSTGDANLVIAVIDGGFDMTHPDLMPNFWTNAGEIAGNNIDDDGNTLIDDIHGYDFWNDSGNIGTDDHGTSVSGCVGARGDNNLGVSGTCPNCSLMLLRLGSTYNDHALAFDYARAMGAQIITNSWGYAIGTPSTAVVETAITNAANNGRGGLGCVVLFAMNNINVNDCTAASPDISSIAEVIAVSRATNQDSFNPGGYGDCMDLLGPTHGGTLNVVTTDEQGNSGYNINDPVLMACVPTEPSPPPANARDYTFCFGGTSAAAPIVAGIAGLILDLDPSLTRIQVQRLLQDTADKIEDSLGSYSVVNGFSSPAAGDATHGYGRANAFEAVRIVAPTADGGLGGVDIFLRDNRLDWGNTEKPSSYLFEPTRGLIGFWSSVDIKVDAPPYQPAPTTPAAFEAFTDENPKEGMTNRVYVRVRNRGPDAATSVTVKLHWAFAGTSLPSLPSDFWTTFPADSSDTSKWHPISAQTIANLDYCGASVAGTAADAAQIVQFNFNAPMVNPTQPKPDHYCLLAIIDSSDDPVSADSQTKLVVDNITPNDNNVTHKNVSLQQVTRGGRFDQMLYVRNSFPFQIETVLKIRRSEACMIAMDELNFNEMFTMEAGEEILVRLEGEYFGVREAEVRIVQERVDGERTEVIGGYTFLLRPFELDFPGPYYSPWSLSLHTGVAFPRGDITDYLDNGLNFIIDFGYEFSREWSFVGMFGYNRFDDRFDGGFYCLNLSANLRYYFRRLLNTSYYIGAGPGIYILERGGNKFGFNLGAGIDIEITPRVLLEFGGDYHHAFDSDMRFLHFHIGLVFRIP